MFRLRNWLLRQCGKGPVAFGECYDNPKFPAGFSIHTSTVLEIEADNEGKLLKFHTWSGSCYGAHWEDIHERATEETGEVLKNMDVPFDMEACLAFRQQYEEEKKKRLCEILHPGWLYAEMTGGYGICGASFMTEEEKVVSIPVSRHVSMFSDDSLLVADWENGLCDFRIFPKGSKVTPYHWSDGLLAVCMENLGDDFVFQGTNRDILCKSKEITVIKSGEYQGEGLISPDVVNGKGMFSV